MGIILKTFRARRRVAVAGLAVLALSGCGGSGEEGTGGRRQVVASVYPLAEAARRVAGVRLSVVDLTPPGVEPHDLELSTDDVETLNDAGVVLYLGGGFQPGVEAVAERSEGESVDVLAEVPADGDDPHVWLDPTLMARVVDVTQAALTGADPGGGPDFARGADGYRRELADLDAEFRAGLADCDRRLIVTTHDAFGYLARRYGLTEEPISGIDPESEPDPRRLAELADLVRRQGVTTVFTESLVSPRVAETLAREAGVRTAVLDPVESLTETQIADGESYLTAMRANLRTLREALGCR